MGHVPRLDLLLFVHLLRLLVDVLPETEFVLDAVSQLVCKLLIQVVDAWWHRARALAALSE